MVRKTHVRLRLELDPGGLRLLPALSQDFLQARFFDGDSSPGGRGYLLRQLNPARTGIPCACALTPAPQCAHATVFGIHKDFGLAWSLNYAANQ